MENKIVSKNYKGTEFEYSNKGVKTYPDFVIPKRIYKYFALSKNSIDALVKNRLYASHPYQINDSFDSSDSILDYKNISQDYFLNYYMKLLKNEYNEVDILNEYQKDKLQNFRDFRKVFVSNFSNQYGSISLTINNSNTLMWSHYTSDKGFCVEFETKFLIENFLDLNPDVNALIFRPIQYIGKIKTVDITKFNGNLIPFLYMLTIKDEIWEYEKEYRITVLKRDMDIPFSNRFPNTENHEGSDDRFLRYRNDAVKSIFLGKHFFINKFLKVNDETLEIEISEESVDIEIFINTLYENYNDKIYFVAETQENGILEKAFERIYFDRIYLNKFRIIRTNEMYLL